MPNLDDDAAWRDVAEYTKNIGMAFTLDDVAAWRGDTYPLYPNMTACRGESCWVFVATQYGTGKRYGTVMCPLDSYPPAPVVCEEGEEDAPRVRSLVRDDGTIKIGAVMHLDGIFAIKDVPGYTKRTGGRKNALGGQKRMSGLIPLGSIVYASGKDMRGAIGRCTAVEDGRCTELTTRDGVRLPADDFLEAKGFVSIPSKALLQGCASHLAGKGRRIGRGYYGPVQCAMTLEKQVSGFRVTKAGVRHEAKGATCLAEPIEWPLDGLRREAAMWVAKNLDRPSGAFLAWFQGQWDMGFKARMADALAFEAFVSEFCGDT